MIGSIYKIIHLDSEIQYIGSTTGTVNDRWYQHKSAYKNWLAYKEKYGTVAIYPYFEQYGIDRFKMILIKSYQVYDKAHLRVYEQLAINKTKCVNQQAAIQLINTKCMAKQYYQSNKDKAKQYYQSIKEQKKDYYQSIKEQRKDFYQSNKQSIKDKAKQYYQSNKQSIADKISTKIECECGAQSTKGSLSRHKKNDKHIRLLAALSN